MSVTLKDLSHPAVFAGIARKFQTFVATMEEPLGFVSIAHHYSCTFPDVDWYMQKDGTALNCKTGQRIRMNHETGKWHLVEPTMNEKRLADLKQRAARAVECAAEIEKLKEASTFHSLPGNLAVDVFNECRRVQIATKELELERLLSVEPVKEGESGENDGARS